MKPTKLIKDKRKTVKPNVTPGKKLKDVKKQPGKSFIAKAKKVTVTNKAVEPPSKVKKPRKVAPPPRSFAAWVVFDKTGKRVETFPYPQRWAAERCVKKKGDGHYVNLLKESEGE